MAPSMLIVLLVAFAVVASPSMAARDVAKVAEAPAPSSSASGGGDEVLYPMDLFGDLIDEIGKDIGEIGKDIGNLPDLPLPRILPCPPAFPIKIPFIPCYNVTPPPPPVTECRTSLTKYTPPCSGFLTGDDKSSPSSPPKKCCGAVSSFFRDNSTTPLCLCRVINGDAGKVNHTRALSVLQLCGLGVSPDQVSKICSNGTKDIPPMDAPSPPPDGACALLSVTLSKED
ncbi:hypothetical protein HU200_040042 [Digitaria exilis]|uniref:Bifunctional inhibitor/plant lipid transfer protein/seed storage helical domain-containing protein n=1 Tax=Digitaria exilis TaxID=1010633 RepID=A0A835EIX9_9POAL|nr:hypothetical protein HU200_040042 [Digitaria exilis]